MTTTKMQRLPWRFLRYDFGNNSNYNIAVVTPRIMHFNGVTMTTIRFFFWFFFRKTFTARNSENSKITKIFSNLKEVNKENVFVVEALPSIIMYVVSGLFKGKYPWFLVSNCNSVSYFLLSPIVQNKPFTFKYRNFQSRKK